jgi:hypothetical protein
MPTQYRWYAQLRFVASLYALGYSMDIIIRLSVTDSGHDAIIVFVDQLTNLVHFVPTTTTRNAQNVARLFVQHA